MKDRSLLAGSLVAGLLASACCIGPLVLGAIGLGSLGFAAALAPLRPWFLGLTAALLAVGFYFAYRRQTPEACAPGQACARPANRRNQRIALWVVMGLAVGLASYPSWAPRLTSGVAAGVSAAPAGTMVTLDVQGMTCSACAGEIERELVKVPGVLNANVDFKQARAEIRLATPDPELAPMVAAVEKAGYHATVALK